MTTRHCGYVVTLAEDIRADENQAVLTALRMISGVISVEPVLADHSHHIAQIRVHREWLAMLKRVARQADSEGPNSIAPDEQDPPERSRWVGQ